MGLQKETGANSFGHRHNKNTTEVFVLCPRLHRHGDLGLFKCPAGKQVQGQQGIVS